MKIFKTIIFMCCFLFLAACSSNSDESKGAGTEKGLLNVEITIPAELYEGQDIDQIVADIESEGRKATKNEDNSITIVLSKAEHKEMMKEMRTELSASLDEMKTSGEFASIIDIEYNDSFSDVTLVVDREAFESSFDTFATMAIGLSGIMFQAYDGVDADKYNVTINIQDEATGEIFSTVTYPDLMTEE